MQKHQFEGHAGIGTTEHDREGPLRRGRPGVAAGPQPGDIEGDDGLLRGIAAEQFRERRIAALQQLPGGPRCLRLGPRTRLL